jgi:ATP adenylyltransferase/5',5'''-P-1,P-4-tetraphosphate phosphorylase II
MINDITFLKHEWNRRFGEVFDEDQRETKIVLSPDGRGFFRVMYSRKLEEWYSSSRGQARYKKPKCFFCDKFDEYHEVGCIKVIGHLEVFFNIKFVMRNHLLIAPIEHREQLIMADVLTLQQLAMLSGLSIFGNLRNSGASYPEHIHYQTLETEFPIVSRPGNLVYEDGEVKLEVLDYPILVFRFSSSVNRASAAITLRSGTFNIMLYGKDIYLIPRTKSIPANTNGFKFAAPEVCGSIFVRERQLFDTIDGEMVLAALRDVCLPFDGIEAKSYKHKLVSDMKGVKT